MKPLSISESTLIRKLSKRKYRHKEGLFMVEGSRAVEHVLQTAVDRIRFIVQTPDSNLNVNNMALLRQASESDFALLSDTQTAQGVMAVLDMPKPSMPSSGLILALSGIQDPGNLGTLYRSAVWFGASGLFLGKGSVDLFNPKVVRSTAGSLGQLAYQEGNLETWLLENRQLGWFVWIMDIAPSAQTIDSIEWTGKDILVLGNEGNGFEGLEISAYPKVFVPSSNRELESLNVAVSGSIALYCWNRTGR